ncbi:hypothetical protein pb186bvf_008338 [Paramecium bursaria]
MTQKPEKGPYDIDEKDLTPRFIRTMETEGFTLEDLKPRNRKYVIDMIKEKDPLGTKINEEIVQAMLNHLEHRRQQKIDLIRKEKQITSIPKFIELKDKLQQSIHDQSILADKSIISHKSLSILNKSIDPLENEYRKFDKIQKKNRQQLFKAQEEEKLLVKQIEFEFTQKQLEERLKNQKIERRRKKVQDQKAHEDFVKFLLQHPSDPTRITDEKELKRQIYLQYYNEYQQLIKQKKLVDQKPIVEEIKTKSDLKEKEQQSIEQTRNANIQHRLEQLAELSGKPDKDDLFEENKRELQKLLKEEKMFIRTSLLKEYQDFSKKIHQDEFNARQAVFQKNLTRQIAEQTLKVQLQQVKSQNIDTRLHRFQDIQEMQLRRKKQGIELYSGGRSYGNFQQLKHDYEQRLGFQEDMLKEIDRTENITKRHRQEEQQRIDNILRKEQLKYDRQHSLENFNRNHLLSDMKKFESVANHVTQKQMKTIRLAHITKKQELLTAEEKEKQLKQQQLEEQQRKDLEEKRERLKPFIEKQKEILREQEKEKEKEKVEE